MAPRNSHWSGRAGRGRLKLAISPGGGRSRRRTTEGGRSTMPQITKEDVCYLKHGERQIMARVFKPEGPGPFPVYVDLHGGAWNNGDLNDRTGLGEYLAERGVVMVTLNFRHGPDGYPTTLQDINYGVRWVKAHAKELKAKPDQVALGGASSGGHLAERSALCRDPRARRGRRQCPGRHHAVAGYQSAVALPQCDPPLGRAEPAGFHGRDEGKARHLLEDRGCDDRGQPDDDPRARRKGRDAAGDLDPGAARRDARLSRSRGRLPGE